MTGGPDEHLTAARSAIASTGPVVTYREARAEDAGDIARVQVDTWRSAYRGIVPDEYLDAMSLDEAAARWRATLEAPGAGDAFFVAEVDAAVVGFVLAGAARSPHLPYQGELLALYVVHRFQRLGIGRSLVARAAESLVGARLPSVVVFCFGVHRPARGFYEKLGAVVVGGMKMTIGDRELEKVAYGWDDVSGLCRMA